MVLTQLDYLFYPIALPKRMYNGQRKEFLHLLNLSKNYGADFIILEVGINNIPAKNMYLSFNFIECGIRKNYYRNSSGSREDAIIMKLNLN